MSCASWSWQILCNRRSNNLAIPAFLLRWPKLFGLLGCGKMRWSNGWYGHNAVRLLSDHSAFLGHGLYYCSAKQRAEAGRNLFYRLNADPVVLGIGIRFYIWVRNRTHCIHSHIGRSGCNKRWSVTFSSQCCWLPSLGGVLSFRLGQCADEPSIRVLWAQGSCTDERPGIALGMMVCHAVF